MARIPASRIVQELHAIESIIQAYPDGLDRSTIAQAYEHARGTPMPTRTIVRRLARLVAEGRVTVRGGSKNTRYHPAPPAIPAADSATPDPHPSAAATIGDAVAPPVADENAMRLSSEAERARALVRRPLSARPHVTYRPEFLEGYQPGETWYLSPAQRAHLALLGGTPEGQRPAGTYARQILGQLLIDLSWGSSRLEGNTYSRLDTKNLIEFGQTATGKDAKDAQMILNHKAAIEMLVEGAEQIGFDRHTFLNLHALLSENLLSDPTYEGGLREHAVGIGGSTYLPSGQPHRIAEWFDTFLRKAGAIPDPFEQSLFVMVQLPYLQPFADVNKRTSRLGANIPLIRSNLFPLSFVDVAERDYHDGLLAVYEFNHVELLRDVFLWAYGRSVRQYHVIREAMGEPDPLRLRYRTELRAAVRHMVLSGDPPQHDALEKWATGHGVIAADASDFAERAIDLLLALHDGSLLRYGLTPHEFSTWRSRYDPHSRNT